MLKKIFFRTIILFYTFLNFSAFPQVEKPQGVIIWGQTPETPKIQKLIESVPFLRYEGEISTMPPSLDRSSSFVEWIKKFLPTTRLKAEVNYKCRGKNTIIVSAFVCRSNKKEFFDSMRFCKEHGIKFFHPASLLPYTRYATPPSLRIKTWGWPGSGNGFITQFIYFLLEKNKIHKTELEEIEQLVGADYCIKAQEIMQDLYKTINPQTTNPVQFSPWGGYLSTYSVLFPDLKQNFQIIGVPYPVWAFISILHDHQFPYSSSLDFFASKKIKQIFIIRNPFGSLASYMRKVNWFCHPTGIEDITALFKTFTLTLLNNSKEIYAIRYEDAITNPIPTFMNLAKYLRLKISEKEIQAWHTSHLYKNLVQDPTHFRKGGKDKWKKDFSPQHFALFKEMGIMQLAKRLGYPLLAPSHITNKFCPPEDKELVQRRIRTFSSVTRPFPKQTDKYYHLIKTPRKNGFWVVRDPLTYNPKVDKIVENSLLPDFIDTFYLKKPELLDEMERNFIKN